jgi:hypothetical protein
VVGWRPLVRETDMAKKKPLRKPAKPVRPQPCSKTVEFYTDVTVGPGQNFDTGVAINVDCYQWLHVWVLAKHPQLHPMDNVGIELVFELTGKMGAAGLANLEHPHAINVRPTPLRVNSGPGGYGGFVIRAPIIGPAVRVIVMNDGAETHDFSVWGYLTH